MEGKIGKLVLGAYAPIGVNKEQGHDLVEYICVPRAVQDYTGVQGSQTRVAEMRQASLSGAVARCTNVGVMGGLG